MILAGGRAAEAFAYGNSGKTVVKGSEGLFAAIEARGNVYSGFAGAAAPGAGALGDFDEILKAIRQARCY